MLLLSFSLVKRGRLGVMFLKRLVVFEATYAKKELCRVLDYVNVNVFISFLFLCRDGEAASFS